LAAIGAVASVAAIGAVAFVVLRDLVAFDRPPAPAQPVREAVRAPVREPVAAAFPAVPVRPPVAVADAAEASLLEDLSATEADDRSALRRVGAALVLFALVLLTATLVGAGTYRLVTGLK
jgi:hypothetical protein